MEDILLKGLEKAQELGASYAEVRVESTETESIVMRNNKIEAVGRTKTAGMSVRVLYKGCWGFASLPRITSDSVVGLIEQAIKLAKATASISKSKIALSEEKFVEDHVEIKPKLDFRDVPIEEKQEFLRDLSSRVMKYKPMNAMFVLNLSEGKKWYANTDGAVIYFRKPLAVLFYNILIMSNNWSEMVANQRGASRGWEYLKESNIIEEVVTEVEGAKKVCDKGVSPPKEPIDVIAGPHLVGIFVHESCGHPYELDRILGREAAQAGESFVSIEMLGKRIGSDVVNVVDDPTVDGSYGFYLYDDEGVKAKKRYLIKNGIINEFLMNRQYAGEIGLNSNAAARASRYDREPIVRMSTTYLEPGDYSFEELIEDVKLGVYIKYYTEWNIDDRRYHQKYVGRESYLIKNGEILDPVKRPVLEITTPELWSSIDAVGKELEFFAATCGKGDPGQPIPVWMGGAPARIRGVIVSR